MRICGILFLTSSLILPVVPTNAADPAVPFIVAHRGFLRHAPENTLANFRACLALRIGFEVDVQRSKDGHLVCVHDDTVDRTTNGRGSVSDLTLAELKALDAGSWFDPAFRGERVPTLAEVFETLSRYPHRVLIAMDLKAADVEVDAILLATKYQVLDKLTRFWTSYCSSVERETSQKYDRGCARLDRQPRSLWSRITEAN
jgi:glycerophosphoryl diester phosphodiesterase